MEQTAVINSAIHHSTNDLRVLEALAEKSAEIERLKALVRSAYHEGFGEGMREHSTSRGGKTWQESKAYFVLNATHR